MSVASPPTTARMFTVPAIAKRLGINCEKILDWVRRGELVAVDISAHHGTGRPRWRVSEEALEDFLRRRSSVPTPKKSPRRRAAAGVKEYF